VRWEIWYNNIYAQPPSLGSFGDDRNTRRVDKVTYPPLNKGGFG
jgi:hypothetical protein